MTPKKAYETVFEVTNVGLDVKRYATVDKHIAFKECDGTFWAIVSDNFAQDNQWESIPFKYDQGKLTGEFPGANRHVVFDYDQGTKLLHCRMPIKGGGSLATAMAKTGNGADDEWEGQPD